MLHREHGGITELRESRPTSFFVTLCHLTALCVTKSVSSPARRHQPPLRVSVAAHRDGSPYPQNLLAIHYRLLPLPRSQLIAHSSWSYAISPEST